MLVVETVTRIRCQFFVRQAEEADRGRPRRVSERGEQGAAVGQNGACVRAWFAAAAGSAGSTTSVPGLTRACLDLLTGQERGIRHVANGGAVSWLKFGRMIA